MADPAPDLSITVVIERLADEQVPVSAIARACKRPADEVREVIEEALGRGLVTKMPRADWHPNERGELGPASDHKFDNDTAILALKRLFDLTSLQAAMFAPMLKRNEVTKETLHQIIEDRRHSGKEETEIKMVDVVICAMRKKLGPKKRPEAPIDIETLWGSGYYVKPETRKMVNHMIGKFIASGVVP